MAPLSGAVVTAAGVTLAEREGVDAVSLRAVAAELRVTPMALYRHISNADALQGAVTETLLDRLPIPSTSGGWQEGCRSWAREARQAMAPVPGLARHLLLHWPTLPRALEIVDRLGAVFEEHAPGGVDAVGASNAVFTYVLMRVQVEEAIRAHGTVRDLRQLAERRHDLPFLWRHRDEYTVARFDEHFDYGLEVLLAGLAIAPKRGGRRRAHP